MDGCRREQTESFKKISSLKKLYNTIENDRATF